MGDRLRQDLDRDVAVEFRVARTIHLAHSASTERACDFEWADSRAGAECHSVRRHEALELIEPVLHDDKIRRLSASFGLSIANNKESSIRSNIGTGESLLAPAALPGQQDLRLPGSERRTGFHGDAQHLSIVHAAEKQRAAVARPERQHDPHPSKFADDYRAADTAPRKSQLDPTGLSGRRSTVRQARQRPQPLQNSFLTSTVGSLCVAVEACRIGH